MRTAATPVRPAATSADAAGAAAPASARPAAAAEPDAAPVGVGLSAAAAAARDRYGPSPMLIARQAGRAAAGGGESRCGGEGGGAALDPTWTGERTGTAAAGAATAAVTAENGVAAEILRCDERPGVARMSRRRKPTLRDISDEHHYCNAVWYRSLHGSVTVSAGQRAASEGQEMIPYAVNLQLHNVRDDGSCALYCLLETARDASLSRTFWNRFMQLETERPLLFRGMQTLVSLAHTETAGCPQLRGALCLFMLGREAGPLAGLWTGPPAATELDAGKRVASMKGYTLQESAGYWEQHAVAFLAPTQFFDDRYQQVLNAFLDDGVAFVTIQYQLFGYESGPTQQVRATRSGNATVPAGGSHCAVAERVYLHHLNMVVEGSPRSVIIWPMCVEQPEGEETSDRNHYQHVRAHNNAAEPTSLAFIEGRTQAARRSGGGDGIGGASKVRGDEGGGGSASTIGGGGGEGGAHASTACGARGKDGQGGPRGGLPGLATFASSTEHFSGCTYHYGRSSPPVQTRCRVQRKVAPCKEYTLC